MRIIKNKTLFIFIITAGIILTLLTINFRWQGNPGHDWRNIIDGDGIGYYEYLNQIFIKHNFGDAPVNYEQVIGINGHSVIKYYSGTALFISPFFFLAYGISSVFNLPLYSYAEFFQKTVSIAAIIYLMLGLLFAGKLLQQLKIKASNIIITLILFLFGTNLLTYTVLHPAMSHVYSFFAVSLFLWLLNSFLINQKQKYLLLSAAVLGLIYLIRPFNIVIVLFILFFIDDFRTFATKLFRNTKIIVIAAVLFLLVVIIQNVLWYLQCGEFFIWSYSYEGFYLLHPEIIKVLIGFRKGLFVYSPILLLSLFGLIILWKKDKLIMLISASFLLIVTYLISAWWCWTYSDGFGMRPFIDFYIIFMILFALFLDNIKNWMRWLVVVLSLLPAALNLFQNYQYQKGIIHSDYMNYERYRHVFLKTSDKYINCFGGANDLIPYDKFKQKLIIQTPAMPAIFTPDTSNIIIPEGETQRAYLYDHLNEYNFLFTVKNSEELYEANKCYAEINLQKCDLYKTQFHKNLFIVTVTYPNSKNNYFKAFPLEYVSGMQLKQWRKLSYRIILPRIIQPEFELRFYIWNKGLDIFLIKDVKIDIFKTS